MKKSDTAVLVSKYVRSLELGKRNYKRSDAALEALVGFIKPGEIVAAKNGRKYELVDEYADKLVVFKPCGVRRFRLEEVADP